MKTLLSIILSVSLVAPAVSGDKTKYEKTMESAITELYSNQDLAKFDAIANKFNRIGDAEANQWLPYYYAGLTYAFKSFRVEDMAKKDAVLDLGLAAISKADKLQPGNAEIIALKGFLTMMKIQVDPGTRGQTLSPGIYADFGKAMAIDPKNPRATLFMAQMNYGTAQFFGSGVEEACQLVEQSIKLFEDYEASEALSPNWGKDSAYQYREMCNQATSQVKTEE